jgi:hypothetical protein
MSSHFQPNVSGKYSTEEFSHPTSLNYCQQPYLFSTVMGVASLQIQTRFLVPLSAHSKLPVLDFHPVSLLRFHMTQYYKFPVSDFRPVSLLRFRMTQNLMYQTAGPTPREAFNHEISVIQLPSPVS